MSDKLKIGARSGEFRELELLTSEADNDEMRLQFTCPGAEGAIWFSFTWDQVVILRDSLSTWLDDAPAAKIREAASEYAERWGEYYDCSNCKETRAIATGYGFCPHCGAKVDWTR